MRILITNDDSISSPVLLPLVQWASKLGEVTVVAPKVEQSGKSHGIELRKPFEVKKVEFDGFEAYTVDSTPADCVRYAVLGMHRQFDLVISGINKGMNIGMDIMYSGTVGAIYEASNLGIPAIALSTDPADWRPAIAQLDLVHDYFKANNLWAYSNLYNVNFPLEYKGIRITRQGGPFYSDNFLPIGNDLYQPTGKCIYENQDDYELDTDAALHGYISITPMILDRTDRTVFQQLKTLNP